MMSGEELQRHIRWQGSLLDWNSGAELWGNLPAELTPTLDYAVRALWLWPIRPPPECLYECRVFPVPMQIDLVTGNVRRMQRVVLLSI